MHKYPLQICTQTHYVEIHTVFDITWLGKIGQIQELAAALDYL